jgi:hypothetical protein
MTLEDARTTRAARQSFPEYKARMERLRNICDEDIDFSDIPEMTDEQLSQFHRVGHDGARESAGRRALNRISFTLRLSPANAQKIRSLARLEKKSFSDVADEYLVFS